MLLHQLLLFISTMFRVSPWYDNINFKYHLFVFQAILLQNFKAAIACLLTPCMYNYPKISLEAASTGPFITSMASSLTSRCSTRHIILTCPHPASHQTNSLEKTYTYVTRTESSNPINTKQYSNSSK